MNSDLRTEITGIINVRRTICLRHQYRLGCKPFPSPQDKLVGFILSYVWGATNPQVDFFELILSFSDQDSTCFKNTLLKGKRNTSQSSDSLYLPVNASATAKLNISRSWVVFKPLRLLAAIAKQKSRLLATDRTAMIPYATFTPVPLSFIFSFNMRNV